MPFLVATIAYCVLLFYLSSVPSFPLSEPFKHFDKLVHFCLFGGLSATIAAGLRRARREYAYTTLFALPVGFSVLYGLSDEIHQLFVPNRTFTAADLIADALGAIAAAALMLLLYHRRNNRRKTTAK
ncbi:VanZ family protein [Candidatus Poribacteria bacterium]|nr:VanZ family protein [Candidatus Poribacteria bacterium]